MTTSAALEKPMLVTVVDDDRSILRALERLLRANGFSVETFSSAEEFLGSEGRTESGCLVVDIHLAGLTGLELWERFFASRPPIPTVFMTAYDREGSRSSAERVGAAYLRKPFDETALIAAIRQVTNPEREKSR